MMIQNYSPLMYRTVPKRPDKVKSKGEARTSKFSLEVQAEFSDNVAINNRLRTNGLPGVATHGHYPGGEDLNNNVIVTNEICGNSVDTEDAAPPGPTGINVYGFSAITGTVIARNVIKDEDVDITVKTAAQADAHLNDLLGKQSVGVHNLGTSTINVTENWWRCSHGPGAEGCASVTGSGVLFTPWL